MNRLLGGLIILVLILLGVAIIFDVPVRMDDITTFEECADAGYPVMESFPRQCRTPDGETFVENVGNASEKQDLIQLYTPQSNEIIQSPLVIRGRARGTWFFEASFGVYLEDAQGNRIAQAAAESVTGEWMTEDFVPFAAVLEFNQPATEVGMLILEKSNPSGLPENADALRVPVRFGGQADQMIVEAYFGNSDVDFSIFGEGADECNTVFAVLRAIPRTTGVARAALEQLLSGPTDTEEIQGFVSNIPEGVTLQNLVIDDGTAFADFSDALDEGVGGSCRVTAIRTQIEETLKQFDTVDTVVISINGETEDILQP